MEVSHLRSFLKKRALPLALALALAASPTLAHLSPEEHGSFLSGLSHPLFGLDHVLAMIAVGLWGAVLGGRARWALPTSVVGSMVLSFGLALLGVGPPFVESMVLASVLLLGLAVALMLRLPLAAAGALAGLFGLFHGHANGGELGAAGELAFGLGFVASTAVLHAVGLFVAWGYSHGPGRSASQPRRAHHPGRALDRDRRLGEAPNLLRDKSSLGPLSQDARERAQHYPGESRDTQGAGGELGC